MNLPAGFELVDNVKLPPGFELVGDNAEGSSWGEEVLNLGKAAVSLSAPLITWPTSILTGLVAGLGQKASEAPGQKTKAGEVWRQAKEESEGKSAEMLKMYEPDPGSYGAGAVKAVGSVFEQLGKEGRAFGQHIAHTWGIRPDDLLWELVSLGGELKAYGILHEAGKGVKSAKLAVEEAAKNVRRGLGAKRLEGSLEYTPSIKPPVSPATGGVSVLPIQTTKTRPTPKEEIERLRSEDLRAEESLGLMEREAIKKAKETLPEGFELVETAKTEPTRTIEDFSRDFLDLEPAGELVNPNQ